MMLWTLAVPKQFENKGEIQVESEFQMKAAPSHDEISQRAFDICQARGGLPGREEEDWFQAEQELASWDDETPGSPPVRIRNGEDLEATDFSWALSVPPPRRPRDF